MDLDKFQQINAERGKRWHNSDLSQWSLLEWSGAMCGEAGEAANIAKKIKRIEIKLPNKEAGLEITGLDGLKLKLAMEVADTIIYGLLIMSLLDVEASSIIKLVFDKKSKEYGFPERAE